MEPPDEELIQTISGLGNQIGQFLRRKQAEEDLRGSHALHRAILTASLDCIIGMDHRGVVIEWNPAAERTFGVARVEAIGKELAELVIPPRLRERHRQGLAHYLETGEGPVLEKRIEIFAQRAGGEEFPVELAIMPIRLPGHPATFTAFVRDISERKRAEAALNLANTAMAATSVGVVLADARKADQPLVYVNPAFERITGYAPSEVLGRNCRFLQGPETDPAAVAEIREAVRQGRECAVVIRNHRKDGTAFLELAARVAGLRGRPAHPLRRRAG